MVAVSLKIDRDLLVDCGVLSDILDYEEYTFKKSLLSVFLIIFSVQ